GSVVEGATTPKEVITFENSGDATLNVTSITLPTGFSAYIGLTDIALDGDTIEPANFKVLQIQLDTDTPGEYSGNVSIVSDDDDENPYTFAITGTVLAEQEITVTHDASPITDGEATPIDFGSVEEGGSALSETFVITNDGEADLVIS